jgi:hypothetical protein
MALPESGEISLGDVQTEWGGSNPISIDEYYGVDTVPESGEISLSDFYGTSNAGQVVFTSSGTWTAPAGVTSVHVVAVGSGYGNSGHSYFINTATVAGYGSSGPSGGSYVGDGGGSGGDGSYERDCSSWSYGDCGGAGGYSGNGGSAVQTDCSNFAQGGAGSGGGGGAGSGYPNDYRSAGGGGVGILGEGSSGAGGTTSHLGGFGGSGGADATTCYAEACYDAKLSGNYGGGAVHQGSASSAHGTGGGGLGWKNNITVTAGTDYSVVVNNGGSGNGAVRIIWGSDRAFPSTNTADVA